MQENTINFLFSDLKRLKKESFENEVLEEIKHISSEKILKEILNQACLYNLEKIIKEISKKINIHYDEELPMRLCVNSDISLVKFFIENKNCDPHAQDEYLFRNSVYYDNEQLYHYLLDNFQIDIHKRNEKALCYAISIENREKYAIDLINRGADIFADNCKPFLLAIKKQKYDLIDLILKKFGKIKDFSDLEQDIIEICLINQDKKMLEIFKKNGIKFSPKSQKLLRFIE